MKQYKVKPSTASVLTLKRYRPTRHYFHSAKLGNVYAIQIDESENLPRPAVSSAASHVDLINEEIELFEQINPHQAEIAALFKEWDVLNAHLEEIELGNSVEWDATLEEIDFVIAEIKRLQGE